MTIFAVDSLRMHHVPVKSGADWQIAVMYPEKDLEGFPRGAAQRLPRCRRRRT
jgi:hypothetical protein